jgi:hypothetical protein
MSVRREAISRKLRFEVLKRDGFRCVYCGIPAAGATLVLDHVIPVAEGGATEERNLVAACEPCNQGKGKRPLGIAERMAGLPVAMKPSRIWSDGDALFMPRDMSRRLPQGMRAEQRHELVEHIWDRPPGGGPFRFGGATVELLEGRPPRSEWADPEAGVL